MWGLSYTTALFWNYLMEQLGNDRAEPGVGTDFIREFSQNAQDAGSNRDFLGTLRSTITDFDKSATLEGLFHDFTVANYTKICWTSACSRTRRSTATSTSSRPCHALRRRPGHRRQHDPADRRADRPVGLNHVGGEVRAGRADR